MQIFYKNKYAIDFFATVMFFTRIPIKWSYFSDEAPNLTRAAWAFPLVGYLLGFCSGVIGDIFLFLGLPIFLSCVIAIGISLILSGAFHEDGLADMADGFGAGGAPERINEIMHDSRLGTYGVTALTLGLSMRLGLVACLVDLGYSLVLILSTGFASGKLAIIVMRNSFYPSKFAKTGSIIGEISPLNLMSACLIWLIPVALVFPVLSILLGIIFIGCLIYFLGIRSNRYVGGITGDILGAVAFLSELMFLLGIILILLGGDA